MKYIFEGNWVFLAHESQIPEIGDYFTVTVGRQPVVITRDKTGELNAILNTCSHRGATLCRRKRGNKTSFTCPFHGWSFKNDGKFQKARDQKKVATQSSSILRDPMTLRKWLILKVTVDFYLVA